MHGKPTISIIRQRLFLVLLFIHSVLCIAVRTPKNKIRICLIQLIFHRRLVGRVPAETASYGGRGGLNGMTLCF